MTQPTPNFNGHSSDFWDARYREPEYAYGVSPNLYLAAQRQRFLRGQTALVPGDGEGRNSVWLASLGLKALAIDLSQKGLRKGQRLAAERGVSVEFVCQDLAAWNWPIDQFDLVAPIYLHLEPALRPRLHAAMARALRPGGLLVIEAFTPFQVDFQALYGSGGPQRVDMLYTTDTLVGDFIGCRPLELFETQTVLEEGAFHSGPAAVVRGVFQRIG